MPTLQGYHLAVDYFGLVEAPWRQGHYYCPLFTTLLLSIIITGQIEALSCCLTLCVPSHCILHYPLFLTNPASG